MAPVRLSVTPWLRAGSRVVGNDAIATHCQQAAHLGLAVDGTASQLRHRIYLPSARLELPTQQLQNSRSESSGKQTDCASNGSSVMSLSWTTNQCRTPRG